MIVEENRYLSNLKKNMSNNQTTYQKHSRQISQDWERWHEQFMKLPLEERRRWAKEQAEHAKRMNVKAQEMEREYLLKKKSV